MKVHVGTSGFSYSEWKGSFYPEKFPNSEMLRYYGERLGTVEINNTFYRMPKKEMLEKWPEQVPADFTFVLKASQRITHMKRLKEVGDEVSYFFENAAVLGDKLGPVLFQLPPYFHKEVARLEEFLKLLPAGRRAAFEFRHESWNDPDVYNVLRAHNVAVCIADTDEETWPFVATADWGYLRLRGTDYQPAELADWRKRVAGQDWDSAYVFFKHEDAGRGPALAAEFIKLL
jgi:uncharacterized protein YecE (DUF72 family)